ncbi:MAG: hypothetical protein LDL16_06490 [Thiobacillus sp.]|nr:hypothetical protein [Thiobacillus sp.]
MSAARRRTLLFALLAGALGWSAWLALNEPAADTPLVELAEPRAGKPTQPAPAAPAASAAAEPPVRLGAARANLFPEQTWFVPPPPPPPPPYVPPPPPQAPALPYAYMGRWLEGGETTWYLTRGSMPLAVRSGQILDGVWRLESPRDGVLNFTYLPLNQTRSLRTGD